MTVCEAIRVDEKASRESELQKFCRVAADLDPSDDGCFVEIIRAAQIILEISDSEMGDLVEVSRPTVNRWKRGVNLPYVLARRAVVGVVVREVSKRRRHREGAKRLPDFVRSNDGSPA